MVKRAERERPRADWWTLGGEWLDASAGLEHGQHAQALATFAADRDLKPITVRKAAATRTFVERLRKAAVPGAERFATLPLERLEALQRIARFGEAYMRPFAVLLAAGLRGEKLVAEEQRLRREAGGGKLSNEHGYRLRASFFEKRVIWSLAAAFPPPAMLALNLRPLGTCLALACDAVVRRGAGYVGVKSVPVPGEAGRVDRGREYARVGLANSRIFEEYWFVCERQAEADLIGTVFAKLKCGVGVAIAEDDGTWTILVPVERDLPADLAVRFTEILGRLFE